MLSARPAAKLAGTAGRKYEKWQPLGAQLAVQKTEEFAAETPA